MEPGSILVERELPIDGALVGPCLLRLRRDTAGPSCTWTLGGHGAAELDVHFRRAGDPDGGTGAWSAGGRLWEPDRLAVATVVVELWPSTDRCGLRIRLGPPPPPRAWRGPDHLVTLAGALATELAEELLWHASRPGPAPTGA